VQKASFSPLKVASSVTASWVLKVLVGHPSFKKNGIFSIGNVVSLTASSASTGGIPLHSQFYFYKDQNLSKQL